MDDAGVIRADAQLTSAGKQERIAELQDDANRKLQQFREDYVAAGTAAVAESMKQAFSHSSNSDVLLLRDAALRAQQLESEGDASALLATALRQNDDALAKEVVLRAIDQRWSKPVNEYAAAKPGYADDIRAVWDAAAPSSWRDGFSTVAMAFSDVSLRS
ncbi:MAG: hypothetical protein NVV57_10675 [Demequina sp.]|jgi:hypothetical protein|nr:hypothetical protein [Demequina sp.]